MTNPKLKVDEDFAALCPDQTEDEYEKLRASIIAEGCRDPIIIWKGHDIIVDGHTRYTICTVAKVPFKVREMEFATREAVVNWIILNQLGRRNLTEEQKAYLRGKMYTEQKREKCENLGKSSKGQNDPSEKSRTSEKIAEVTGVTEATVRRDAKFAEAVDKLAEKSPELKTAALHGEIPKSAVAELAEASKADLKKVANAEDKKAAAKAVASKRRPAKEATPADLGKAQIKTWADTINRWLQNPPTIDDLRKQFPGKHGDGAVKLATALYEALTIWHKAVK